MPAQPRGALSSWSLLLRPGAHSHLLAEDLCALDTLMGTEVGKERFR